MTQPLTLSLAELAVVFQHLLGPDLPGGQDSLLTDLEVAPEALTAARLSLRHRGVLLPAPDRAEGRTFLAPDYRPMLATVVRPQALLALRLTRPNQPPQEVFFSWTPEQMAWNRVEADGQHVIEPLDSLEALADAAMRASDLAGFTPVAATPVDSPEALANSASLMAALMAVANMRTTREEAQALSWLVSGGQLWLLARQGEAGPAGLRTVSLAELRAAIVAAAQQTVDSTKAALEAEL